MFIILAYDIGIKRLSKARKIACKYLIPIQKSVYEGFLTDKKLLKLQQDFSNIIDYETDSVVIYKQSYKDALTRLQIGRIEENL